MIPKRVRENAKVNAGNKVVFALNLKTGLGSPTAYSQAVPFGVVLSLGRNIAFGGARSVGLCMAGILRR